MDAVEADVADLQALARHCVAQAAELGAITTPTAVGQELQPTAAALAAAHAGVETATGQLSRRLHSTAAAVSGTASGFAAADADAATAIAAIGSTVA